MAYPASLEDTSSPQIPISQSYLDGQNAYAASQASPFTHTDSSSNTSAATQVLPAPSTLGLPIITPSVKQKANGSTGSGGKTLAVAFPNNVTDGNSIVVLMGMGEVEAAGITLAITDLQGNTYTQAVKGSNSTTQEAAIFYTTNTQLGANTVTATIAGGSSVNTAISMEIYEVEGLITVSSLIVDQTASNNNVGSTAISTANITPNYPNELAFMAVAAAGGTIAVGTGWASDTGGALSPSGGNLVSFGAQSRFQMTQGPLVPAATLGTSNAWAACTAVFRPMHLPIEGTHLIQGGFTEQASLSAGSLNADLVPSTDVSAYKWFSIHTNTNAFVGTMTIQGSNDNANWVSILANQPNNAGALSASITATNTLYVGIVAYRFLRVRMTAYTSGTAQATLELYTSSSSMITMGATQQGTWTVQPGNTANTTPWLVNASQIGGQAPKLDNTNELGVSLYGKNSAAGDTPIKVNSSGDQYVLGDFTEQSGLSAGSLNADLVASTDVSAYKSFSLQVTGAYVGTLTFQGSNDNANWNTASIMPVGGGPNSIGQTTATSTGLYGGHVAYRYLRVRMTSYTSGTANATLELYTSPVSLDTIGAYVQLFGGSSGIGTVNPGNTANTTPWLESIHDGTNKANVLASTSVSNAIGSQGALLTGGAFAEQASLSAGSLNADLVPSTDVSNYKSFSLHINTSVFSGTLSFQCSNDNVNWSSLAMYGTSSGSVFTTINFNNAIFTASINFRYLRIRMTAYTSGTAQGTLELYTVLAQMPTTFAAQTGTWTVQPGNTANTTPWLESIHDGTNKANVLAATSVSNAIGSQGALLTGGAFAEQASLSAGSLNADLVASTDVSNYKSFSIQITGVWTGTIQFQGSNDNVNFSTIDVGSQANTQPITNSSVNGLWYGFCSFRYLRVRMTSYTSGTANGVLELYTQSHSAFNVLTIAGQSGTWTVQPGNTANTTPWLESIHDGTNKANVLAATSVSNAASSQGALLTAGAFQEVSFTTTTVQAVATTDVSNYKWASVHITSQGTSSVITFQGSNDNVNWKGVTLVDTGNNVTGTATNTAGTSLWHGPIGFRYFRLNVTGISAGTTAGVIEFYTNPTVMHDVGVIAAQSGAWSVGPATDVTLIASAAFTTTQTTADQTNNSGKGIRVVLDMTSVGTGSVTLEIDAKDVASGKYVALLTGAAVTTNSTNVYVVYPGLTPAANAVVSDVLPRSWRVKVTANNANTATYSVGASYLS